MPTLIENLKALKELAELIKQDVITSNLLDAERKLEMMNNYCINSIIKQAESILE